MTNTKKAPAKKTSNSKKSLNNEISVIETPVIEIIEQPITQTLEIETIEALEIFNFNTGVLKSSLPNKSVKPEIILKSMEGGVLDRRKCNYTGKQILQTVTTLLPMLSTSEVFIYPDSISFPSRVIEKKFPEEIQADLSVPISQTCFNRFIARIDIAEMPEGKLSFCMKFDGEKGVLEASIGYNHTICSNYTIFSRDQIKTLGREFDYTDFRNFIDTIKNGESYLIDQFGNRIEELTNKECDRTTYYQVLGAAYNHAAKVHNSLQYTNLNLVAQKNVQTEIRTAWDVLNAFTLGTRIDTGKGLDNLNQLANTCEFVLNNI